MVVRSQHLPHLAARVAVFLAMEMDANHREATSTIGDIAAALNASKRGVISAIEQLETHKFLGVERKRHAGNRYWLLFGRE
ncbi:hypothetical protein [Sinorhizobium meliloti]|uniref:hypothetical protein n=1 Tax=Rhizobium meliloti TaxID=382 RepID=UPI003F15A091